MSWEFRRNLFTGLAIVISLAASAALSGCASQRDSEPQDPDAVDCEGSFGHELKAYRDPKGGVTCYRFCNKEGIFCLKTSAP